MSAFLRALLELRRGPWETVATALIVVGVAMLLQPFALWAFSRSFAVTLSGTLLYVVVSHFRE
jgi:hypothetical protein